MPYKDKFHVEGGELIRQITMGMNDGVVSIFALLAGIAGAGQDAVTILVTLIAATIAGALSMAAGTFISEKSERDYFNHEIEQERLELIVCPDIEREEIDRIYSAKGFSGDILKTIVSQITADPDRWVREMVIDELGIAELEQESGFKTSIVIFMAFIMGSLFPVLPYMILASFLDSLIIFYIATAVTFTGLFAVGALKKYVTGVYWLKSGIEMLVVGLFAFGISYIIGMLVGVSV
jgi:VIT1/CCC1 family predicted Fe2+/Mn2+ transporter